MKKKLIKLSMSIDTAVNPVKVVLDTNIIISGIGFGGKPRKILHLALENKIKSVTSAVLLAELEDVITKKFPKLASYLELIHRKIKKKFLIVKPKKSLFVVGDEDDNRVLEAAVEGDCEYIITGDQDLLRLNSFRKIEIVNSERFLEIFKTMAY